MRSKPGDMVRLTHIIEAIQEIETYCSGVDFGGFLGNSMMRFACVKQLEIIGKAGNHISEDVQKRFSTIEWGQIVGMRNVFVQEYFGIDPRFVW